MNSGQKEFSFFWFIENYSYSWHKSGKALISPPFTADGLEGTAWNLWLYPRGETDEDKGHISLFLNRSAGGDGPESVSVRYQLSFLATPFGSPFSSVGYDAFKKGSGNGFPTFLKMDEILLRRKADYLPQDILTVSCKIWKGEGNIHKVEPICARTRIGIEKICFPHVVENFSTLEPKQKHLIKVRSHSANKFFALCSLYYTYDSCREGEMVVEIMPIDRNHILSKRKISLLGSGNVITCSKDDNRHDVARKDIRKLPLSLTRQVILNTESECLHDDKLSLLCECVFSTGLEFKKIEETRNKICAAAVSLDRKVYRTVEKMSEAIKALYTNQSITDVELKTKTKSFPAHKLVLCARSPVFKAMMTSDVNETNTDCIQVDDLGDDVVQQLLHFLYFDTVENLQWEMASRLYYAADKYRVDILKEVCSLFLVENLNPTNVGELLLLADTHSDSDLKKVAEDFILEHEEQVFGSEEWEMLVETHPLLVVKAMHLKYKKRKLK